jgi:hypothetical protein
MQFWCFLGFLCVVICAVAVLGASHPSVQWIPGTLSLGVKRPRRVADHSPPSSAEVKNEWSYTSTPLNVYMAWPFIKRWILLNDLVKHRDNFAFNI